MGIKKYGIPNIFTLMCINQYPEGLRSPQARKDFPLQVSTVTTILTNQYSLILNNLNKKII